MPQERYNAQWVLENRVGVVLDSFRAVRSGVAEVTSRLAELRSSIGRIQNRAVFEIPEIIDAVLQQRRPSRAEAPAREAGLILH
jgi:hypothetical protein